MIKTFFFIKSDSEDIYNVTQYFYLINAFNFFYQRILKKVPPLPSPTLIQIIRNVTWAENQHIKMISEGSCYSEDWSNWC